MAKKSPSKKAPAKKVPLKKTVTRKPLPELGLINPSDIPREDPDMLVEALQASIGGEGVIIQRASDMEGRMDLRRPSGITSLDMDIGGGLPAGGMSQIDGIDGVGKNLLLNYFYAANQRIHGDNSKLFQSCFEFPYDKMFGRACGVKVSLTPYELRSIARSRKLNGEELSDEEADELKTQVGKFHIFRGAASEKVLQAVVEAVEMNTYQIGGIDSWDAMLTIAEDEKDLEDNAKVADASNLQTRWMRKIFAAYTPIKICPSCFHKVLSFAKRELSYSYTCPECEWKGKSPYLFENETTLIGIRQVRANMGGGGMGKMRQREYKVGGSWALKHGKLVDIQLRPGEVTRDKSGNKVAKEINWELTKGKAGTHEGKRGSYWYHFSPPEIDVASDMVNYCTHHGIIEGAGRGKYKIKHSGHIKEHPEIIDFSSKIELQRAVEEDENIRDGLTVLMLRHAGLGHVRYR